MNLGDLDKRLRKLLRLANEGSDPIGAVVGIGGDGVLFLRSGLDRDNDSKFWFVGGTSPKDLAGEFAIFSPMGLIEGLHALESTEQNQIVRPRLYRNNAFGNFRKTPDETEDIGTLVDNIYGKVLDLKLKDPFRELFQEWSYKRLVARFGDPGFLVQEGDIIPDYNDTMAVIKLSEGCPRSCNYCPEPLGGFKLYSPKEIRKNIKTAHQLMVDYHGRFVSYIDEIFLNSSDLLWFNVHKSSKIKPHEIIEITKDTFSYAKKIYAFVGVPTTKATELSYLLKLRHKHHLTRVLVGIESAHNPTSKFLGKNETYQDKREALEKLVKAGYKVKAIVQVGMTGKGFWEDGIYHDSYEALEATAKLFEQVFSTTKKGKDGRTKHQVLISRYVPLKGTRLEELHRSAGRELPVIGSTRIVPYNNQAKELEEQVNFLKNRLRKVGITVQVNYEQAIAAYER